MFKNKHTLSQVIVLLVLTLSGILLLRSVFKCKLSYRAMQAWKFKIQERTLPDIGNSYLEKSQHYSFQLPSTVLIPRDDPRKNLNSGFYEIGVHTSDAAKSFVYKSDRIVNKSTDNHQRSPNTTTKARNTTSQVTHFKEAVQKKSSPNLEHPWVYHAPFNQTIRGKRFNVTSNMRSKLHIPITKFVTLSKDTWLDDIIFVTAASQNHFDESLDTIGSIQHNVPNQKVLYYDLGLKPEQVKEVKLLCNVIYRPFNLSMYPPHFKNLGHCAWKPVIIHEALLHHNAVFWVDSSVRILHSLSKFENLYERLEKSKGIVLFSRASHTIFPSVHPQMFQYLPSDLEKVKESRAWQAGLQLIFKTEDVYNNILYWWTMCCLDPNCVSPISTKKCADKTFSKDKFNCHRFDQSALNIILQNYFKFDPKIFGYFEGNQHLSVKRGSKNSFLTKVCPKH